MGTLLDVIDKYSIKKDYVLKKICEPLSEFGIPYLWYYFIEADGTFGALTNDVEYSGYYVDSHMHANVPYYSHPSYFKSGYIFSPCAFKNSQQKQIKNLYAMENILMIFKAQETRMEGFGFYNRNFNSQELLDYLPKMDLLEKFIGYFKREAASLITAQKSYNIKKDRGQDFYKIDNSLLIAKDNSKTKSFLKKIYNLSSQEERCLELYRQGYSAQATAAKMNLSQRTIESYFENIKFKLKCHSKSELLQK